MLLITKDTKQEEISAFKDKGGDNTVLSIPKMMDDAKIYIRGTGNILVCEDGVTLSGIIDFKGNDSVVYLSKNRYTYKLDLIMWGGSTCYIGKNNYFNRRLAAVISERRSFIVGDDCLFSREVWVRTADPHLMYDIETSRRLNPSKDVLVGDHVWIGQRTMLLKGSRMGSGSVLAAGAIASGKAYSSNAVYGGIPAKKISSDIFFTSDSVHAYSVEQTDASQVYSGKRSWKYSPSNDSISRIDELLGSLQNKSVEERLSIIESIRDDKNHNRFAIGEKSSPGKKSGWLRKLLAKA